MARLLALVIVLLGVLAPAARAADDATTAGVLAHNMRYAGAGSGALVVDLDSGRQLYASRADVPRVPASVEKLFTTAAALQRFGPEGTLNTQLLAVGTPDALGILDGNLYVRGHGDPTFGRERVDELAGELVALGISELTGSVVGDESAFDGRRGANGWAVDGWVGPLSALVYGRGIAGGRFIKEPALGAAKAVRSALLRAGIFVGGKARAGRTPSGATALAGASSPPMRTLIRLANVPSDNFVAEMLVKALGSRFAGRGSTAAGLRVVRATLRRLGLAPRLADGSGLSRSNRTSPRQVVALLRAMQDEPDFVRSLAVAGRTGTLHDRMRSSSARGRCRGKTGTIIGVSALAGYCTSRTGARTAFAFLMNGVNVYAARRLQDRMAGALARYSG